LQLLVWIFVMRLVMVLSSVGSYWLNQVIATARYRDADKMDFERRSRPSCGSRRSSP